MPAKHSSTQHFVRVRFVQNATLSDLLVATKVVSNDTASVPVVKMGDFCGLNSAAIIGSFTYYIQNNKYLVLT